MHSHAVNHAGNFMQIRRRDRVTGYKKGDLEKEGFYKTRQEERYRVTSRRAGLETDSAGSLRQHKDGGRLGGKAPTLSLPRRRTRGGGTGGWRGGRRDQEVRGEGTR